MVPILKNNIQKNFSRSASRYDQWSAFHRSIGLKMLESIKEQVPRGSILDVGMGTGWLTEKIKDRYPEVQVVGLDFAYGMVRYAKRKERFNVVQADAGALPFKDDVFDRVVSNLAFQWVEDLSDAGKRIHKILKDNGVLQFSCFGEKTLEELFISLEETREKEIKETNFRRLNNKEGIGRALYPCAFADIVIRREMKNMMFDNLFDLLFWLKNIGANSSRINDFVGRDWLLRADRYYRRKFGVEERIPVTFEIIWVTAKK